MTSQSHLEDPNKEGLTTIVNYQRSPGVALARVLDHPLCFRLGVQPQIINLTKFNRKS